MKNGKRIFIGIIAVIAGVIFAVTLVHALFYSSAADLTVPHAAPVAISNADYPVTLSIPKLNIHAAVQQVGVTADGKMAVPTNFTDVGWYKYGTVPGQTGSAVIAGHVDDGLAIPAVFIDLDKLQPGDDIYIVTKENHVLHFVMTGSQAYDRNANTDQIFNEKDGKILRLITCTGDWLPLQRTHNQRLVVTAVLR